MDTLSANPFAVLTFIVAPAILTNASSIMALGTSNRFARSIDRARALAKEVGAFPAGQDVFSQLREKQLRFANRRVLLLVRVLTAFYVSVGAFAAASLVSLLGALFVLTHEDTGRQVTMLTALGCGAVGVGGLVVGSTLLVWDGRLTLVILNEETKLVSKGFHATFQREEHAKA